MTVYVNFQGRPSGNGECFCWDDVPDSKTSLMCSDYSFNVEEGYRTDSLCPSEVCTYLGCNYESLYNFTIIADSADTPLFDQSFYDELEALINRYKQKAQTNGSHAES